MVSVDAKLKEVEYSIIKGNNTEKKVTFSIYIQLT